MAMAERFLAQRYNRPGHAVVDHRVYAIASDGDLMEGVAQEAASLAGAFGLGKLDRRATTTTGSRSTARRRSPSTTRTRAARFEAYGWHVQHVADVNDLDALDDCARGGREPRRSARR